MANYVNGPYPSELVCGVVTKWSTIFLK